MTLGWGVQHQFWSVHSMYACHWAIGVDVTKRLEKNDQWSKGLKSKYNTMLQAAQCANREDFPLNNEIFVKGCAIFMSKYKKAALKKISNHLNPKADEFEKKT